VICETVERLFSHNRGHGMATTESQIGDETDDSPFLEGWQPQADQDTASKTPDTPDRSSTEEYHRVTRTRWRSRSISDRRVHTCGLGLPESLSKGLW
jgi:hypothetical protein